MKQLLEALKDVAIVLQTLHKALYDDTYDLRANADIVWRLECALTSIEKMQEVGSNEMD